MTQAYVAKLVLVGVASIIFYIMSIEARVDRYKSLDYIFTTITVGGVFWLFWEAFMK